MTIRPISDHEADALARITLEVYAKEFGHLTDDYVAELADVRGRAMEALVLVAVDDEAVAAPPATVLGGITYIDRPGPLACIDRPDQAELRMLVVVPQAQGRGIGTALVQACLERARGDGKREVILRTADFMKTARRLYERAGFRRYPQRDEVVDDGIVLLAYALGLGD